MGFDCHLLKLLLLLELQHLMGWHKQLGNPFCIGCRISMKIEEFHIFSIGLGLLHSKVYLS